MDPIDKRDENRRDESDESVPPSERGKGESMPMERRTPSAVFGLVGLSYMIVLILALIGIAIWLFWNRS